MKKLINKPDDVVKEELEGMALAYGNIIKVHMNTPNARFEGNQLFTMIYAIERKTKTII